MVRAERLLGFMCGWGWIIERLLLGWEPPEPRVHRGLPVPLASLWPALGAFLHPSGPRDRHALTGELLYSTAWARIRVNNIRATESQHFGFSPAVLHWIAQQNDWMECLSGFWLSASLFGFWVYIFFFFFFLPSFAVAHLRRSSERVADKHRAQREPSDKC